jgi:RHS repeat-associated protein
LGNVRLSYFHNGSGIEVLEENNYYPFGLNHEGYNALAGNPAYQYKYNGKELQETGMYDYGARFYMPDIERWGVVDPLAEQYRRHSNYNYAVNNPINFIDPDGMAASPIFDENGTLLGTDDQGVKGNAIIMNKKDFTQGMAHSEALKKGTLASTLPESSVARQKADSFVDSAPNRPDYDGKLTFNEANSWARGRADSAAQEYGNGNLFVDVSKIDTSKFDYQAITSENKKGNYFFNFLSYGSAITNTLGNYLLESDNTNTGLIYGNVRLEITAESRDQKTATLSIGNRSTRLVDLYDFDTKNGSFMKRKANAIGEHTATVGGLHKITPYSIYGYGNKIIKK